MPEIQHTPPMPQLRLDTLGRAHSLLEKAEFLTQLGDFLKAIPLFEEAKNLFFDSTDYPHYLQCQNRLLRLYAETEKHDLVISIKDELQDHAINRGLPLTSRTYYLLGISAAYRSQLDTALEYGQKSLNLSLETHNKEDTCYAISLIAAVYRLQGRPHDALRELYNLRIFFEVISLPEIQASATLLNALILIDLEKYDESIEILWQTYEVLKLYKSIVLPIQLLCLMAQSYRKAGHMDLALSHIKMAELMTDPSNMPRLYRQIKLELKEIVVENHIGYDLVFNETSHEILEKKIGRVDFRNQFVLLDLLKLFITHPGQTFSKEYLVEKIWHQSYDPAVHDNKVYVTIKRLRKMIEPDFDKPKYIFRAKNGYFMSKTAKVLIQNPSLGNSL
jgi:tetratricopeptide (TPR) repeat protein